MRNGTGAARATAKNFDKVLESWIAAQSGTRTLKLMAPEELKAQCSDILKTMTELTRYDLSDPAAAQMRDQLVDFSRKRGLQGFSPTEIATYVMSLKDAILPFLKDELKEKPDQLADEINGFNRLIDQLSLSTFSAYMDSREAYVREQQRSIQELSTPVVEVWEGILALPIIGSVDTARTQQMMEGLLTKIVDTGSAVVIIDITGVPVVDTAVAKHLLQTVQAARLLGTQCILVGISARIAQTLVHLGVDLSSVLTGTTLARGLDIALSMTKRKIVDAE